MDIEIKYVWQGLVRTCESPGGLSGDMYDYLLSDRSRSGQHGDVWGLVKAIAGMDMMKHLDHHGDYGRIVKISDVKILAIRKLPEWDDIMTKEQLIQAVHHWR